MPQLLTPDEADNVYSREVEAVVAWKEPLKRLINPFVQAAMVSRNPGLSRHLLTNERSIYNKYAVPLDHKATAEMTEIFKCVPGLVTVAFDGAAFNGKLKVNVIVIYYLTPD